MKTPVEQLAIALYEGGYLKGNGDEIQELVDKAKEMEKEQIVNARQSHPIQMRVIKTKSTKDDLCQYCQNDFATCPKANHIKFGNGFGNDNVIECSEFTPISFHNNYPIECTNKFAKRVDLNETYGGNK